MIIVKTFSCHAQSAIIAVLLHYFVHTFQRIRVVGYTKLL